MRILIVSAFFPPINSVASLRPHSWAKYWSQQGHNVTVVTQRKKQEQAHALKYEDGDYLVLAVEETKWIRSLKRLYQRGSSRENFSQGQQGAVRKRGFRKFLAGCFNALREKRGVFNSIRMPDFSDLWVSPAVEAVMDRGEEWDVVVSSFGPYSSHKIALYLKRKGIAKHWIADFRDLWTDHHFFKGLFPFTLFEKMLERRVVTCADVVTVVSKGMQEVLGKKYPGKRVHLVENGYDPDDLQTISSEPFFPSDGKRRLVYTGMIYKGKRDPSPLFQAIAELAKDPRHASLLQKLEVLFAGPLMANLDELIEQHQVSNWVKNLGVLAREDALRLQRDADTLLFLEWGDPSAKYMLTGKLFEYLSSATPILSLGALLDSEPSYLIGKANAGVSLPNEPKKIKEYLVGFLSRSSVDKVSCCQEILDKYSRKNLAFTLLGCIENNNSREK
ncbi:glycosyltransferase [Simkania negevensis]|uniref:Glycosyltransferase n=1 Tax=Simkania negevensis TaxID=83561 RepID=A0ABS3AR67_9BACT|nr:glycosyltransferase [Simkania negevensis]